MREYESPTVELIEFDSSVLSDNTPESGCNCHMDANNASMAIGSGSDCEGITGHASENPFGIAAKNWTFG